MLIIAGLGNPGNKYANHRHNIGFMAVDEIAHRHSFSPWKSKFQSLIAEGNLGGEKILLLKPQTMMNLSGQAIGEAMRFYKLSPDNIIVLYDELDLAEGKVRFKIGGGAGGHNGIRSTIDHCGKEFHRLRLGIGHPGHKDKVVKHVLGDFAKADNAWLEPLLQAIGNNANLIGKNDQSGFMNKIALAVRGEEKPKLEKKQSRIKQARQPKKEPVPKSGPMAEILKKLLGKQD